MRCPIGSIVSSIGVATTTVTANNGHTTAIQLNCSDSGKTVRVYRGASADNGRSFQTSLSCAGGFSSTQAVFNTDRLVALQILCPGTGNAFAYPPLGETWISSRDYTTTLNCEGSQRIVGIAIWASSVINSVRFLCSAEQPLDDSNIHAAAYSWGLSNSNATWMYGSISMWDISRVTNMAKLFGDNNPYAVLSNNNRNWNDIPFPGDALSSWNVSSVTDMSSLFNGAIMFNGNVSAWSVRKVTSMNGMFRYALSFNNSISSWAVLRVTMMYQMFYAASSFNQQLSSWFVQGCTNFANMFQSATSFNQDISTWNTSSAKDTRFMFYNATAFNGNVSLWNTSSVAKMYKMFYGASSFSQTDVCWDRSKSSDTSEMFIGSAGRFSSFPYPDCRNFHMLSSDLPVTLIPSINATSISGSGYYFVPNSTTVIISNQKRIVYPIEDPQNYVMDDQIVISFNFLLSQGIGRRHSICFLEKESDLNINCTGASKSSSCFDIAGSSITPDIPAFFWDRDVFVLKAFR